MKVQKYNKKAFTLIEVLVATSILMISVFGVYKLIGENAKIINNSDNYLQLNSLFPALEACIDKIGYSGFSDKTVGKIYDFDFGYDMLGCNNNSSSGIVVLDNIEYELSSKIINHVVDDFIDFELRISADGVGTNTGSYKLVK